MPFRKEYLKYDPGKPLLPVSEENEAQEAELILRDLLAPLRTLRNELDADPLNAPIPNLQELQQEVRQAVDVWTGYSEKAALKEKDQAEFIRMTELLAYRISSCVEESAVRNSPIHAPLQSFLRAAASSLPRLEPRPVGIFAHPPLRTPHSYPSLHARVSSVTSVFRGGSQEFTDLRTALEALRSVDTDPEMTADRQRTLYDQLAKAAELYLEHRIPDGNTDGLSEFAASRVQFARDALEFAEAKLDSLARAAEAQAAAAAPGAVRIIGTGKCMEYDPVNNVYVCFVPPVKAGNDGGSVIDRKGELLERMRIRNGGEEPDADMLALADALSSDEERLAAASAEAQQAAEKAYTAQRLKGFVPPVEKEAAPVQEHAPEVPAEAEEAQQSRGFSDLAALEDVMLNQQKLALQIMTDPRSSAQKLLQAVTALMTVREYGPNSEAGKLSKLLNGAGPGPELTEAQMAAVQHRDQVMKDLVSGTIPYGDLIDASFKKLQPLLPIRPKDSAAYLESLRAMMQERARRSQGSKSAAEECLFDELDKAAALRTIPDVTGSEAYRLGLEVIEANRDHAYRVLAGDPSPAEKDEALLNIAACHTISEYASVNVFYAEVLSGRRKNPSIDVCRKIHEYITTVTEIGSAAQKAAESGSAGTEQKNPRLEDFVEAVRMQLAPILSSGNSLAKERVMEACRSNAVGRLKGPELYKRESGMMDKLMELNKALSKPQDSHRIATYLANAAASKKQSLPNLKK